MSYKTRDGKVHTSTVLMGENGFPVDAIATIAGSYRFIEGTDPLTYTSGSSTVSLSGGYDLTPVTTAKARYTGKYILLTNDGSIYYIDRKSIDVALASFSISLSDKSQITPASIDLSAGWEIAEADIVNRMATTSAAKIDNVEFRDMQFQLQLDGDLVTVRGDNGNTLEPNADGSITTVSSEAALSTPTILNTNLTTAGDVYEIDIPVTARRFMVKARNPAKLEIAYNSGPSSFITVKPGSVYTEEGLTLTLLLTLYIKSNKDNTVIETVYWE